MEKNIYKANILKDMQYKTLSQKLKGYTKAKSLQRIAITSAAITGMAGSASAEVINTTMITGIFDDLEVILPAMGDFVVSVVPVILILAIIGFVTGFFKKILGIFDHIF